MAIKALQLGSRNRARVRDGKLIRYLAAFGRAIKLDKDESAPLQVPTTSSASAATALARGAENSDTVRQCNGV